MSDVNEPLVSVKDRFKELKLRGIGSVYYPEAASTDFNRGKISTELSKYRGMSGLHMYFESHCTSNSHGQEGDARLTLNVEQAIALKEHLEYAIPLMKEFELETLLKGE